MQFGNITQPINADTNWINPNSDTFVLMVETFKRRVLNSAFLDYFKDVGLCFVDECHRDDFFEILQYFESSLLIGLTATPICSNIERPMNTTWDVMLEIATTSELQHLNSLNPKVGVVPCECYALKGIDRSRLSKSGVDFNEKKMSVDFRDELQVENTLYHYETKARGMKGLCFNVDIEHNEVMQSNFDSLGVPCRQLHSKTSKWFGAPRASLAKHWRKDTLLWFKHTDGAIINNVGILTTGFDETSSELAITNFASLSLSKVVQCHVRCARPHQYKDGSWKTSYKWMDFGGNCQNFNIDGNNDIDWKYYWDNPKIKKKDGVGGYKTCPICSNLNPVSARFCSGLKLDWLSDSYVECGYIFPISEKEVDLVPREMIKFYQDKVQVSSILRDIERNGFKVGSAYHKVLDAICLLAKDLGTYLEAEQISFLVEMGISKIKELGKLTGKKTFKESVKEDVLKKLQEKGFIVNINEVV